MPRNIQKQDWYRSLLDDVEATIITTDGHVAEMVFRRNLAVADMIWRAAKGHKLSYTELLASVASDIGHSERKLWTWKKVHQHYVVERNKTPDELYTEFGSFSRALVSLPAGGETPPERKHDVNKIAENILKRIGERWFLKFYEAVSSLAEDIRARTKK